MQKEHVIKLVLILILSILIYKFGVMFFFADDPKNAGWANGRIEGVDGKYDVVVVGEEPEGIAAAVSAARMGAKTLLISEGDDLGGVVSAGMLSDLEANLAENGGLLNRGIFAEFYNKLGYRFTIEKYKAFVNKLVKGEKRKLKCIYGAIIGSPKLDENTLTGINLTIKGENQLILGKRFIDATRDGSLLNKCGVPHFKGSEDLNMEDSFLPVKLNFLIKGQSSEDLKIAVDSFNSLDYLLVNKYVASNVRIRFINMQFIDQGDGTAVVKGLEVTGIDASNRNLLDKAYIEAQLEAKDIIDYLKMGSKKLEKIEYVKVADSFYIREKFHYAGIHTLSVNEVLGNTDFYDKIALGSYPVDGSKFVDFSDYIVGKPVQYAIPLRCLIPLKISNLLMVGSKSSYSSLASTSAATICTNITSGESAGVAAVYTIGKDISFSELADKNNTTEMQEYQSLLEKQKLILSDFKVEDKNSDNFSFSSLKQLRNLGLVAAGMGNDYGFNVEATGEDFAILLLNGVYRSADEKYNLALDSRIRLFFTEDKLTKNKAGEILAALYGVNFVPQEAYNKAIKQGYINEAMKNRLVATNVLKMEDVYVLTAYNLEMFTGKELDN